MSIDRVVNVQPSKTHNAHNPVYTRLLCLLSWKTQISRSFPYLDLCIMSIVDATRPHFLICWVWQPLIVSLPYWRQDVSLKIEHTRVCCQSSSHVLKICLENVTYMPLAPLYGTKPFIWKPTCAPTFQKRPLPTQIWHLPSRTLDRLAFIRKSLVFCDVMCLFVWMASMCGK